MNKALLLLLASASSVHAQVAEVAKVTVPSDTPTNIDISVTAEPSYVSWTELSTSTLKVHHSYFIQRGNIALRVKEDPWTFKIKMEHLSLNGTDALPNTLSRIPTRYPLPGSGVFVSEAYMDFEGHLRERPFHFQAGAIPMKFGEGLALSDNGMGIFGMRADWENVGPLNLKMYSGNTESSSNSTQKETFHMGSVAAERMGSWELGYLYEIDSTPRVMATGNSVGKALRKNTLIHYSNLKDRFTFNFEGVFSQGHYSILTGGPHQQITSRGNAFKIEGGWSTELPRLEKALGTVDLTFLYAQGSGDKSQTKGTDESFFSPLAARFDGAQRSGWGELLGATAYDALGSSATWNGLPQGLSGISTFGFGLKTRPYDMFGVPVQYTFDRYVFRAGQSDQGQSKSLGSEFVFGALIEASDRFKGRLSYYIFDPDKAYDIAGNGIRPISGLKATLSLSFQ